MSHYHSSETWSSPHEYMVSDVNRAYVAELERIDIRIGDDAASKFGRAAIPRRALPVRIARRVVFEAKKLLGPLARKVSRVSIRHWNKRVADRNRIPDGSSLLNNTIEVHSLLKPGLFQLLEATSAQFWLLTREPNQLLASAVGSIAHAAHNSSAEMWFGDSRNVSGIRERRPVFSRLLLRQVDALGPVVIARVSVLREVFSDEQIPQRLWPLALGLQLDERQIELIPEVLGIGDVAQSNLNGFDEIAAELVRSELLRSGIYADVDPVGHGRRTVSYSLPAAPLISIIIPTRGTGTDGRSFVVEAVRSITNRSTYTNYELVIVADEPTPPSVVESIDRIAAPRVRWVRWSEPFNFSSKMNLGAACATGKYLLFLNDDIEVVSSDWIERMLSLLDVDDIGYVGSLLFFEDQSIQHAGHFYAGGAGHVGIGRPFVPTDSGQTFGLDRICSGVTAACSLIKRSTFELTGGFSTRFPGNYNDVDLCKKLEAAGVRIAVAGRARLYHFESKSRDARVLRSELSALHLRWYDSIQSDRYWRVHEHT